MAVKKNVALLLLGLWNLVHNLLAMQNSADYAYYHCVQSRVVLVLAERMSDNKDSCSWVLVDGSV